RPGYAPPAAMTPEGGHDRPRPGTVISRAGYPMGGVISRGGVARGPGAGQDRKQDVRGVPGVMVDLEPAPQRAGRHAEGLRGPEVAREPRERAAADLDADPVPGPHPVRRRVEVHVDRQDPVVAGLDVGDGHRLRAEPADAVRDVA